MLYFFVCCVTFGPVRWVPKTHSSCCCSYQFSKNPEGFLIRSRAQQNFAHTFVLIFPTDYHALQWSAAAQCMVAVPAAAQHVVEHIDEYLCTGGAYRRYRRPIVG